MKEIIRIENCYKYFPIQDGFFKRTIGFTKAVDGVNLSIYEGQTLGIVGESGSGKSTLANMIVGLEKPSSGKVYIMDHEISQYSRNDWKELRSSVQMVFQNPYASLNPKKRIMDILKDPMLTHGACAKADLHQRLIELMDMVALPHDSLYKYPNAFSGGQRQRIAIAKALSLNPKILICDEPTSALDVSIQAQILNLLKSLQKQLNLTIVFIGHGLGAVNYIADSIAVMVQGHIVEYGQSEAIFKDAKHLYTKSLLAAYPSIDPQIARQFKPLLNEEIRVNRVYEKSEVEKIRKHLAKKDLVATPLTQLDSNHYVLTEEGKLL